MGLMRSSGQFGWSFMVTGQSLVLYSRLHLVIRSHKILRAVLVMIITSSIAVEVPNWVTSWFAYDTDPRIMGALDTERQYHVADFAIGALTPGIGPRCTVHLGHSSSAGT